MADTTCCPRRSTYARTAGYPAFLSFLLIAILTQPLHAQRKRIREYGITIGVLPVGKHNAITDVAGVRVGHTTITVGDSIRTGVTAIIPHDGNLFGQKVPSAIYIGNGFGKLTGISQVEELGSLETPIVLTNTLSVPTAADALIDYTLAQPGNENVRSLNPVVGETNDGGLNDIRGRHVQKAHVRQALASASSNLPAEGNVGAGTGTVCFGFKGGIGTASRVLPKSVGGYTVGVLVQTNYGGVLQIDGVPVDEELGRYYLKNEIGAEADGSCMMVVATDAPLTARNLKRLAKRAMLGLAKTGGIAANGSGDYVIAFSTAASVRIPHESREPLATVTELRNDNVSPLFMAVIEATEEAILNSLFKAETTEANGIRIEALPIEQVLRMMKKYNRIR